MRLSFKYKLFLAICLIAVLFIGMFSILNACFYDDFYLFTKKRQLTDIYQTVNETYTGDISDIADTLAHLEFTYGIHISILSKDEEGLYDTIWSVDHKNLDAASSPGGKTSENTPSSENPPPDMPVGRDNFGAENFFKYNEEDLSVRGYTFDVVNDIRRSASLVRLIGKLSDDSILSLGMPVAFIQQSSELTTAFLLIAGVFTLLLCIIIAFFLSKHFSKPILEISDIATSMANLDFSKKYTGHQKDELGALGENINILSEHLASAIQELKETNARLQEEVIKERKIDEMRREFIINVSHELKTPIALVQGYAEGLKVNITSSEEDKNYYCDIIMDEAERMNKLVMQLLDLSKIETGNQTPVVSAFCLYDLVNDVYLKTRLLSEEKQLSVVLSNLELGVLGDFDMIEQVVTNYLTNAIHHTPAHGKIRIFAVVREQTVRVCVENEGDPIPEDALSKLWEKFYKLDKARTRANGGTGIGLSIVRAVMEAHGGAYGVSNTENGVLFYFELPLAPDFC